jgi:hypothetical protein
MERKYGDWMRGGRSSILSTADCKKILGIPRSAANGVAEIEEGKGIMSCCEILPKNSTDGQGRTSKGVL